MKADLTARGRRIVGSAGAGQLKPNVKPEPINAKPDPINVKPEPVNVKPDPKPIPVSESHTIAEGDARVEVPSDWREVECDFDGFSRLIYGPADSDPCTFGVYAAFFGSSA